MARLLATTLGGIYVVHVQPRLKIIAERYFKALYGDPARVSPGTFEGYTAGRSRPAALSTYREFCALGTTTSMLSIKRSGKSAGCPILLLWGSRDRAVYPSSIHQLQRQLKNSALVIFPGAGHLPYEEVPEEFNRVLCDFLLHDAPRTALEIAADRRQTLSN